MLGWEAWQQLLFLLKTDVGNTGPGLLSVTGTPVAGPLWGSWTLGLITASTVTSQGTRPCLSPLCSGSGRTPGSASISPTLLCSCIYLQNLWGAYGWAGLDLGTQ